MLKKVLPKLSDFILHAIVSAGFSLCYSSFGGSTYAPQLQGCGYKIHIVVKLLLCQSFCYLLVFF